MSYRIKSHQQLSDNWLCAGRDQKIGPQAPPLLVKNTVNFLQSFSSPMMG